VASVNWSDTAPVVAFLGVFAGAIGLPVPAMPTLIVVGSTLVAARDPMLILATFLAALAGAFAGDTACAASPSRRIPACAAPAASSRSAA
jgi:membrane protein DedA with SNARE-associated domain